MNMDGPAVVGARAYRLADRRQGEREKKKKDAIGIGDAKMAKLREDTAS